MTGDAPPPARAPDGPVLAVLTSRPRPEEVDVLRALGDRLSAGATPLTVLLLNDAVYLAESPSGESVGGRIDWLLLEEDARGRGVKPRSPARLVSYAEAVEMIFHAGRVVQFP